MVIDSTELKSSTADAASATPLENGDRLGPYQSDYHKVLAKLGDARAYFDESSNALCQMSALFRAIAVHGGEAGKLAELGQSVADDWANTLDIQREEIDEVIVNAPIEQSHRKQFAGCACPDCSDQNQPAD